MDKVILVIGIVIVLWGIWIVIKPGVVKAILIRIKGPLIYVPGLLRIALGVVFLVSARDCQYKWVVIAFGVIFFAAGIGMFMIKPARLKTIFERWANRAPLTIRMIGIIAAAIGAVIAYIA